MIQRILVPCIVVLVLIIGWTYTSIDQTTPELEKPSYFDEAQWQRIQMRGGEMDPTKMQVAREKVVRATNKTLQSDNLKDAGLRGWSTLGPCNVGGRVRAIGLQPTPQGGEIIYVGAAGGGLWRSTNLGSSYTLVDDIDLSLAVTSISVDPLNSDVIYVSTGEGFARSTIGLPGVGIFRSVDGGNSFELLSSTANDEFYWVNKVVADPHVAKHVYAVVLDFNLDGGVFGAPFNGGGILKESFDSGETWTDVFTGDILTDIDIHPVNPLVQVVSGHGTLRVKDGNNWIEQVGNGPDDIPNFPGRIEVALSADDQIMYALVNGGDVAGTALVYRSDDGGDDWESTGVSTDIFSSPSFGNYSNTIWVDPIDEDHETIYLGGVDLWKSTNAGSSFTKVSDWRFHHSFTNLGQTSDIQLHADQHIILPSLSYSKTNPKVYIGNDGGIQKADDISVVNDLVASSGWDNLTGNMCTVQFYGGAVSSAGQFAGGAQDNGILLKDNNNYSVDDDWTHPQTGDGADVYFRTENTIYATVNFNRLVGSTDGGETFFTLFDFSVVDTSFLVGPSAYDRSNFPERVYLGGERLWYYDTDGLLLQSLKNPLQTPRLISAIDVRDNFFLVGYENGVMEYSFNGGALWSGDVNFSGPGSPPNSFITDIHIVSASSSSVTALVTFGGYRSDQIFEFKVNLGNGVFTWRDLSLDFDMHVNTVTTHPFDPTWIYVGTDVGVFASEDGGENWSVTPLLSSSNEVYNNEGPFYVEVQELFWDFENTNAVYHLCAATFGRGIIRSDYALVRGAYIDQSYGGTQVGTEARPFSTFLPALGVGENAGTPVIFLEGGLYDEFNTNRILNDRVIIRSEAASPAIIR